MTDFLPATKTKANRRWMLAEGWNLAGKTVSVALAAVLAGFAVVALSVDSDTPVAAWAYVLAVAASGVTVARHRFPALVLIAVVAARLLITAETGSGPALMPAVAVVLYSVARHGGGRSRLTLPLAVVVVMAVVSASLGDESFPLEFLGELAQGGLPIAVADAARARADRIRDLIEAEAEARVDAERLRIARDLHDVVAHGLSTIAVQSGVAAHLIDRDPDQAREALDIINTTGKASLEELRSMVGVLRSTDSGELRPAPADPNDIRDLMASAANSGIEVTSAISGRFPADVGDAVVVAVHRIVQEALTNVARHAGSAETTVGLHHHRDHVVVEVTNKPPVGTSRPVASTGVGIVGMRERAESLGGSLDCGPTDDGGYRVSATVPYYRDRP